MQSGDRGQVVWRKSFFFPKSEEFGFRHSVSWFTMQGSVIDVLRVELLVVVVVNYPAFSPHSHFPNTYCKLACNYFLKIQTQGSFFQTRKTFKVNLKNPKLHYIY